MGQPITEHPQTNDGTRTGRKLSTRSRQAWLSHIRNGFSKPRARFVPGPRYSARPEYWLIWIGADTYEHAHPLLSAAGLTLEQAYENFMRKISYVGPR